MTASMRSHFGRKLDTLNESILELGNKGRHAVVRALRALLENDPELAREVIAEDINLNKLRYEIEKQCYALIVTEQPVASDLRTIVAALTSVADLERIGDHGKKIARIYLRMSELNNPIPMDNIVRMSELALAMVERVLRAYAVGDTDEAQAVCQADDQVDALYKQTFNVLLTYMLENPALIGPATYLLQIAHELERIGDRATNIGERVIFSVTGELTDLNL